MVARTRRSELEALGIGAAELREMSVLECGGSGRDALGWSLLGVKSVTHVDLSEENPRNVRRYCAEHGIGNVESRQGDLLEIDLPAEHWDVVRSRGVLHHLRDPALGLARYTYWAKPGGLLHFNAYRGGTFYYYGVKLIREIVREEDLEPVLAALTRLHVPDAEAGILLDDFFVPHMHTASPACVERDLARAGLTRLGPRRSFAEVDHDLLYPDMPEKVEHLQYWCRVELHPKEWVALARRLEYHAGVDDVALGRAQPGGDVSYAAFEGFRSAAERMTPERRAEALIGVYGEHHYRIATVAMRGPERHRRLAEVFRREATGG
jgi:SAM-dependent methyltransferase